MEQEAKRYEIKCPYCNATIYACKSLGMEVGFSNHGSGTCVKCNKHFFLKFDYKKEKMTTSKAIVKGQDLNDMLEDKSE